MQLEQEVITNNLPEIVPLFQPKDGIRHLEHYSALIQSILSKVLPSDLFYYDRENPDEDSEHYTKFLSLLPIFEMSSLLPGRRDVSFYLVSPLRSNAFKFFFDMIIQWMVPGKRLNVSLIYAVDFTMPKFSNEIFTVCELMVAVDEDKDLNTIRQNATILGKEIKLGVKSSFWASKILEIRGLSIEEKTALVHQHISMIAKKRPQDFSQDIFNEVPHMLVMCPQEFKKVRSSLLLTRIICIHYLFKKSLKRLIRVAPSRRHLSLKLSKQKLETPEGTKHVLSFMIGVNFLHKNEVFEENHLLKAVRNYVPNVVPVEGSFLIYSDQKDPLAFLYLEVEKGDKSEFSHEEVKLLRRELSTDIKDRIEHLMHPVFMPKNEEEIMRNILILSKQLVYTRDLSQVMINFDTQSSTYLSFTVLILRVLRNDTKPLTDLIIDNPHFTKVIFEQRKTVGLLRKKYPKEASVLEVRIPKVNFLRDDHSIDLFKARDRVSRALEQSIGEFRDYNGGMISKQNEAFSNLSEQLGDRIKSHEFLLENFFYSIQPSVMRNILPTEYLKQFFLLLLDTVDESFFREDSVSVRVKMTKTAAYAIVSAADLALKESLEQELFSGENQYDRASTFVHIYDTPCFGYLLKSESKPEKEAFLATIKETLAS